MKRLKVYRHGVKTWAAACVIAGLLAGCGGTAEPTFSPSEAATRLAAIPTAASVDPIAVASLAPESAAPTLVPEAAATAAPTAMPIAGNFAQYLVKAGDTLSTIAFNFKISMASIQLANQLGDSQIVRVGQSLKIPQTKMFPDENVLWILVAVEPGDTLGAICQRYGTSLDDTVRVNELGSASDIRAGQLLIMPIRAAEAYGLVESAESQAVAEVLVPETAANSPATPVAMVAVIQTQSDPAESEVSASTDVSALPTDAPEPEAEIIPIVPIVAVATAVAEPTVIPEPATPIPAPAVEVMAVQAVEAQKQAPAADMAASVAMVSAAPMSADPFGAGNVEFMRARMLVFYNQARAEQRLGPLNLSFTLQQAAQLHAQDCAARGYGSHVGSDGSNSLMRVQRAGFYGKFSGENWAWGHTAEEAFDMWFTQEYPSGPHRDNILGVHYTDVGFGIVASQGGYYFIANLGAS